MKAHTNHYINFNSHRHPRILIGIIKCLGVWPDRILSQEETGFGTPGAGVVHQWFHNLHSDEIPVTETTSLTRDNSWRWCSISSMYVTSVRGHNRSVSPWKLVLLSSLLTHWDSLLYMWKTVYLLRRRMLWCMRTHAKIAIICTSRKWEGSKWWSIHQLWDCNQHQPGQPSLAKGPLANQANPAKSSLRP